MKLGFPLLGLSQWFEAVTQGWPRSEKTHDVWTRRTRRYRPLRSSIRSWTTKALLNDLLPLDVPEMKGCRLDQES